MNTKCRTPLIRLCDSDGRIKVQLDDCYSGACSPEVTKLCLEEVGCPRYERACIEEVEEYGCGCCHSIVRPKWVEREVPRNKVCYPLLEIDNDGMAVFVLDDTLREFGYGRYRATLYTNDCDCFVFDVDYTCGTINALGVSTQKTKNCGGS